MEDSKDLISRRKAFEYFVTLWECIGTIMDRDEWEDVCMTTANEIPSAQPEPCEDAVSRKAVEEMLKNGLPARGMWEIEGDVVKQTVCETLADALIGLERLPSAQPEPAIPLQWIEGQIEWLKSLDNAFSTLTAGQISALVNKWESEQDG